MFLAPGLALPKTATVSTEGEGLDSQLGELSPTGPLLLPPAHNVNVCEI